MANLENLRRELTEFPSFLVNYQKTGKQSSQTVLLEDFLASITEVMSFEVTDETFHHKKFTCKTNFMFQQEMSCKIIKRFYPDIGPWGEYFIYVTLSSNSNILEGN